VHAKLASPTVAHHLQSSVACCCTLSAANVLQYIISVREIMQSVLPPTKPANAPAECAEYDPSKKTRVWAYGSDIDGTAAHNWPAFTIKATVSVLTSFDRSQWHAVGLALTVQRFIEANASALVKC
jgi:hypothetical protein